MQSSPAPSLRRFASTVASTLYFLGCILAAIWASRGEPTSVRMAFVIFGFVFFLFSFLTYFYHIANFSQSDREQEARQLHQPPPPPFRIVAYVVFGLFWAGILMWLLLWRFG